MKYKVIEEIHVYSCIHGQLKMEVGTIFEICDFGETVKVGNVRFSSELLRYCKEKFIKFE